MKTIFLFLNLTIYPKTIQVSADLTWIWAELPFIMSQASLLPRHPTARVVLSTTSDAYPSLPPAVLGLR